METLDPSLNTPVSTSAAAMFIPGSLFLLRFSNLTYIPVLETASVSRQLATNCSHARCKVVDTSHQMQLRKVTPSVRQPLLSTPPTGIITLTRSRQSNVKCYELGKNSFNSYLVYVYVRLVQRALNTLVDIKPDERLWGNESGKMHWFVIPTQLHTHYSCNHCPP